MVRCENTPWELWQIQIRCTRQENNISYILLIVKRIVDHKNQGSLSNEPKKQTNILLNKHRKLFNGNIGTQEGIAVGFKLRGNNDPYYAKPYSIPVSLKEITKQAIEHMCDQQVLREAREDAEWAAPKFTVPKKNGGVRIVNDFRQLNRWIKRSLWPMPTTRVLMHRIGGMAYVTALDQILAYCTIQMSENVWKYLTKFYRL